MKCENKFMLTLLENLGLSIKRLQERHHRKLEGCLTPIGLTVVQWHALREIDRYPGSSQLLLAELTFNSPQAFGMLISRMQIAGFVERDSGVGRAFALHLTSKGKQLLLQGRRPVLDTLRESFAVLDNEEQALLQQLINKMLREF